MKFVKIMSKSDQKYLGQAVDLAKMSDCNYKHGAVIRKSGKTIAVGVNYGINDPAYLTDEVAAEHAAVHAEVAAMNACRKVDLNGATLYVARVIKNGDPRMSKPCERCQEAMRKRGIKKVFYTLDDEMTL